MSYKTKLMIEVFANNSYIFVCIVCIFTVTSDCSPLLLWVYHFIFSKSMDSNSVHWQKAKIGLTGFLNQSWCWCVTYCTSIRHFVVMHKIVIEWGKYSPSYRSNDLKHWFDFGLFNNPCSVWACKDLSFTFHSFPTLCLPQLWENNREGNFS